MTKKKKICWILTNSNAGALTQAIGLAENMGLNAEVKHIQRVLPFSLIPPFMKQLGRLSINFTTKDSSDIKPPWPDVVIACGAQSVHFCLYIRKQSKGKSLCIYLQDPKIPSNNFDLVIKMEHDSIQGENVIESKLSLNRITPKKLEQEKLKHDALLKKYPPLYTSILIGGSTKRFKMNNAACDQLLTQISDITSKLPKSSFFITTSRRTPLYFVKKLNEQYKNNKNIYIVDPKSKTNPYLAMLAVAEEIFVTNDSVNMISEACSAGKRVHIIKIQDFNKGKPVIFANNIVKNKLARFFDGKIHKKTPTPPKENETKKIAKRVQDILIEKYNFSKKDFKNN